MNLCTIVRLLSLRITQLFRGYFQDQGAICLLGGDTSLMKLQALAMLRAGAMAGGYYIATNPAGEQIGYALWMPPGQEMFSTWAAFSQHPWKGTLKCVEGTNNENSDLPSSWLSFPKKQKITSRLQWVAGCDLSVRQCLTIFQSVSCTLPRFCYQYSWTNCNDPMLLRLYFSSNLRSLGKIRFLVAAYGHGAPRLSEERCQSILDQSRSRESRSPIQLPFIFLIRV